MRSASSASTSRPVRIRSFATPRPQTRASRCVPPQPGMIPRLISGWPSFALDERVAQVAGERELAAAAEREAVDRGDRRLRHRLQQLPAVVAELAPRLRLLDREAAHVLDVGAGDERLLARAGEHDHARPRRRRASSCSRSRSSSSVGRSSAFIASGRSIVTVAIAPSRSTTTLRRAPSRAGTRRSRSSARPGVKTAATPCRFSSSASSAGIVPPSDDEHVLRPVLAQPVEDPRDERHVRAGEDRDPDRVGVLLDRGLDDLLGRLVEAGVDDLHPRVAQRTCDDLRAPVVPVETGLRYDDTNLAGHLDEYMSVKLTVVGCSPAWPNPGGAQSGYLLEGPGRLLLDCGPACWRSCASARPGRRSTRSRSRTGTSTTGATSSPGSGARRSAPARASSSRSSGCRPRAASCSARSAAGSGSPRCSRRPSGLHEYADGEPFTAAGLRGHRPPRPALPAARVRLPRLGERDRRSATPATPGPSDGLAEIAREADLFVCEATLLAAQSRGRHARTPQLTGGDRGLRGLGREAAAAHAPAVRAAARGARSSSPTTGCEIEL